MSEPPTTQDPLAPGDEHAGPVARPPFQLRSLPVSQRWEVTRRHPYYLMFWEMGSRFLRGESTDDPRMALMGPAAVVFLNAIGVSGEPPDPALPFSQLGGDGLHPAWLSGAVHPISFRGMSGLILAGLPKTTLMQLGVLLIEAAREDTEEGGSYLIEALLKLQRLDFPGLNEFPDEPLVSVNPAASGRTISTAMGDLLKDWKTERQLIEQRDRSDKYAQYLNVWDRREGWTGSDYDPKTEQTFAEIAATMHESSSTIGKHYGKAFEMITGHKYRPGLWYRIFMCYKCGLFGFEDAPVSRRRPAKSPTRNPVPESRLGIAPENLQTGRGGEARSPNQELLDLMLDVTELIQKGKSDAEILDVCEVDNRPAGTQLIHYLRRRI